MEESVKSEKKEIKLDERFEFLMYMNDYLVAKCKFGVDNFIEGSMSTMEFKNTMDYIQYLIDDDLKSKSRVHTWYYYNPEHEEGSDEFTQPLSEPWEYTFKIVIRDNGRDVISRIWDGYGYPFKIRRHIDITNKFVKVRNEKGESTFVPKEEFFENNQEHLSHGMTALRGMIMDRKSVIGQIIKVVNQTCSNSNEEGNTIEDYTTTYGKYDLSANRNYWGFLRSWEKVLEPKTKAYFTSF